MKIEQKKQNIRTGFTKGRHGVIVIHGIGEQKKGETLAEFANSLAVTLIESEGFTASGGNVQVNADLDCDPAMVTLLISPPTKGSDKYTPLDPGNTAEWVCKEAYWQTAFQPPPARDVMKLVISKYFRTICRRFLDVMSCLWSVTRDPFNNVYGRGADGTLLAQSAARPGFRADSFEGFFAVLGHWIIAMLAPLIALAGYLALAAYWIIGAAAGILHIWPALKPIDKAVGWLHENIDPFLSTSIGDLSQFFENTVWGASIRHRLETIITDMLRDDTIADITIVAHSMGCLVTYEALTKDGAVARELQKSQNMKDKSTAKSKRITFVSFGGATNLGFDMIEQPNASAESVRRIKKPLAREITGHLNGEHPTDKFFWLDMYSRLDPVPAGQLSNDIIEMSTGNLKRQTPDPDRVLNMDQIELRQVVNKEDLFQDHPAYWTNHEMVIARIAKAINGGTYPWDSLEPSAEKAVKRVQSAAAWVIFRGVAVLAIAILALVRGISGQRWIALGWGVGAVAALLIFDIIAQGVARAVSRY
jgi:hypothetical protein